MAQPHHVGYPRSVTVPLKLNAERWQRLESLFQLAVELPADAREPFIQCETAGDDELAGELRAMLAHDAAAAESIAGAVEEVAQGATAHCEWIGRRVGPYRIVREIGRGGMGTVFEAVRDGEIGRASCRERGEGGGGGGSVR